MNPLSKLAVITLLTATASFQLYAQNVGINSDGATPDASAMLDVSSTSKGLLVPRVELTATNAAGPITLPTTSLLVYNTVTAGTVPYNVIPGYYYWNGTAWIAFNTTSSASTAWVLGGNNGTSSDTNFIGTTDDNDLVFKTDNSEVMRLYSGGSAELNAGAGTVGTSALYTSGDYYNYLEINVQNLSNGNLASSDIVATANNGSASTVYVDLGINSQGYSNNQSNILNGPNLAYLYAHGRDFKIGNGTPNRDLIFFTNPNGGTLGTNTANGIERMRITQSGNVGIGTSNVTYTLEVNGSAAKTGGGDWSNASDRRLKKDIRPFGDGLQVLTKINPVWYKYNGLGGQPNNGKDYVGVIAQDIQPVAPYTISTFQDAETKIDYLNYDGSAITYILVNAVKEQQVIIENLKKQVEDQEKRLQAIEAKLK
jgi:hypothetical protein